MKGSDRYPAGLDTSRARQSMTLEGLGRKSLGGEGDWVKERPDKYAGKLRGRDLKGKSGIKKNTHSRNYHLFNE